MSKKVTVTFGKISKALENAIAYYKDPATPSRLIERETEMCQQIKKHCCLKIKAFYGSGYPFWAYYTQKDKNAPLIHEIIRHIRDFKRIVDSNDPDKPHHCLSEFDETKLVTTFKKGLNLRKTAYRCKKCKPNIPEIFYVMPDGDVYFIVDKYPNQKEIAKIEQVGKAQGFFPLYSSLNEIIESFANNEKIPKMSFDYVFVKKDDFVKKLKSTCSWQKAKIPCMILRYGTESIRKNWLDLGWNMVLGLQPFKQYDLEVRKSFNRYLIEIYSKYSAAGIIKEAKKGKAFEQFKRLFLEKNVVNSFKKRYFLGRKGKITDLL